MSDDPDGFAARNWARVATSLVVTAGMIGALLSAGVVVSTFLPGAPHVPPAVTMTLSGAAIPIMFGAVLLVRSTGADGLRGSPVDQKELVSRLPLSVRLIAGGAVVGGGLIMTVMILSGVVSDGPSGAPEVIDGRYALNDHGDVTFVIETEYNKALLHQTRVFAGGGLALQTGAATLAAAAARGRPARRAGP